MSHGTASRSDGRSTFQSVFSALRGPVAATMVTCCAVQAWSQPPNPAGSAKPGAASEVAAEFVPVVDLAGAPAAGADGLLAGVDVLPTPKQISLFPKGVVLNRGDVVSAVIIAPEGDLTAKVAAEAINDRLVSLGGKALAIVGDDEDSLRGVGRVNLILVGGPARNRATRTYWGFVDKAVASVKLPAQGYAIDTLHGRAPSGGSVVVLSGVDSASDWYAAATFLELLLRHGADIVAVSASVTDWPDVTDRFVWGRNIRDQSDIAYYATLKANGFRTGFHPLSCVDPKNPERLDEAGRKVTERNAHARACGMQPAGLIGPDLADRRFPFTYSDRPWKELEASWDCAQSHEHLYCWSRLDQLRKRLRLTAQAAKALNLAALEVHFVDTDPKNYWPKRCAACRRQWGDDMASWAAANALWGKIVLEEIRAVSPEMKILFIMRPYTAAGIHEPDWRWDEAIRICLEQIPFDANCYICVRETGVEHLRAWRRKWNDMRMYFYIDLMTSGGACPLYAYRSRLLDSFMGERGDDLISPLTYRPYPDPVNCLLCLERMWNRRSCGPGTWPAGSTRELMEGRPLSEPEEVLLVRVCRRVFGREAGPLMAEMYRNGLHPALAAAPLYAQERLRWPAADLAPYQKQNVIAANKALQAMQPILDRQVAVRPDGRRFFPLGYRLALATLTLAEGRVACHEAGELIGSGKDIEAETLVTNALTQLAARRRQLDAADGLLKRWPPADGIGTWTDLRMVDSSKAEHARPTAAGAYADLERALADALKDKPTLRAEARAQAASKGLAEQPLPVLRVKRAAAPIALDGLPDDAVWKSAAWVEQFIRTNAMQLSPAGTRAAAAYDQDHLYFFFTCPVSGADSPAAGHALRDQWTPEDEFIELMLRPDRNAGYYHVFVNPDGIVGDSFADIPPVRDALARAQDEGDAQATDEKAAHPKPVPQPEWDSKVQCRTTRQKGVWHVEIALPLQALRQGPYAALSVTAGAKWTVNLCRSIPAGARVGADYSSLTRAGYADYWLFPDMVFE